MTDTVVAAHAVHVAAVITDRASRVLVVQEPDDAAPRWCVPGARLHRGENPWESVEGIVRERLGLRVAVRSLLATVYRRGERIGEYSEMVLLFDCGRYRAAVLEEQLWPSPGRASWRWTAASSPTRLLPGEDARLRTWVLPYRAGADSLEQPRRRHDASGAGVYA